MPETIITIPTWSCSCGSSVDCEPTQENMDKYFNHDLKYPLSNLKANQCPNCALHGKEGSFSPETDISKKATATVGDEKDVDGFVMRGDKAVTVATADKKDAIAELKHMEEQNRNEFQLAMQEGRNPVYNQEQWPVVVFPARRNLTTKEKSDTKKKIAADRAKWLAVAEDIISE